MNGSASARALRAYRGFHWGRKPRRIVRVKPARRPRELVKLGSLEAVTYGTTKGSEGYAHYEHEFGEEGGKKPALAMDPKNKRLHIVGGDYDVEDRGIVD
jgi:hypothetical protein